MVRSEQETQCHLSGFPVAGSIDSNLCYKAWQLLKKDFPDLPNVSIYLHKAIPMGAGLGGGSADGAFMLRLLNEKFQLHCTNEQLKQYALQLGSDCPFFMENMPCLGEGRGEILHPVSLDLSTYTIALVHPGIHVNTGWAFSQLKPAALDGPSLSSMIKEPIDQWKNLLTNDFETPVFKAHPEIAAIKQQLYASGAIYASMSGSGSTVFGIFDHPTQLSGSMHTGYFVRENIPLGPIRLFFIYSP